MAKTEEDWFLRGGERPSADTENEGGDDLVCQNCGSCWPTSVGETCPACQASLTGGASTAECCGADGGGDGGGDEDEEVLQDWLVTMSRTKTVQQTAAVRVKAHSEEEAMDLIEDRAEDEAENWAWKDDACTEEYDDVEAVEAEVAT